MKLFNAKVALETGFEIASLTKKLAKIFHYSPLTSVKVSPCSVLNNINQ